MCRRRLQAIREAYRPKQARRLRYFTFCAVGAIDVLMLDVAGVIRRSNDGWFDTVTFFDKSPEYVNETLKRIPGANGFPGDFINVVLLGDPEEETVVDQLEPLSSPEDSLNQSETRSYQILLDQRRSLIAVFPFDVINLDLEEFLFKPNDPLPGRVVNALRKIFGWQKRPFVTPQSRAPQYINEFSLMFTTQIGPPNLTEEYLGELRNCLERNLEDDENLIAALTARTGVNNVTVLQERDFDSFFKLLMPKMLAATLIEEDWHVVAESGITIYEFERPSQDGPYKMLHLVMDIKRNNPPKEQRAPGAQCEEAQAAYRGVVRQLFSRRETIVSNESINRAALQLDLDKIKARRRKYYPDEEPEGA